MGMRRRGLGSDAAAHPLVALVLDVEEVEQEEGEEGGDDDLPRLPWDVKAEWK